MRSEKLFALTSSKLYAILLEGETRTNSLGMIYVRTLLIFSKHIITLSQACTELY